MFERGVQPAPSVVWWCSFFKFKFLLCLCVCAFDVYCTVLSFCDEYADRTLGKKVVYFHSHLCSAAPKACTPQSYKLQPPFNSHYSCQCKWCVKPNVTETLQSGINTFALCMACTNSNPYFDTLHLQHNNYS